MDELILDETIFLTDENGEDVEFDMIASFGVNEEDYVALFPLDNNEEELILILRLGHDDLGNLIFEGIEDEEELNEAIEVFQELVEEE